jgi:ketosteroid isomerase-like protein
MIARETSATAGLNLGPRHSVLDFVQAINEVNLPAAIGCFAEDARLVTPDATVVEGRGEIRAVLGQLTAKRARIEVQASSFLVAGRVAIGSERWAIRHAGAYGEAFEQVSTATTVLHRAGAVWKLAIVAPWGWGHRARPPKLELPSLGASLGPGDADRLAD